MSETPRFVARMATGRPNVDASIEEQQEAWRNNPDIIGRGEYPLPKGPELDDSDIEEGNGADAFKPLGRN